jgi:hypothetical protein
MDIFEAGNNVAQIKMCVENGADVNARDYEGYTPLHRLVMLAGSNIKAIKYLVSQGADVSARSGIDTTPLHIAVYTNKVDVLKYLISKGADINAKDCDGNTPLDWVSRTNCSAEIGQILREAGGHTKSDNSGCCYIATAVYGSYDAPEVLCLRRFRDEILSSSIFGRLFISLYYFFSPPVAEKLKKTRRVNAFVRKVLDKFVERLDRKFHNKNRDGDGGFA